MTSHSAYLTEQVAVWQTYLDHADMRARLHGLRMLRGALARLIITEACIADQTRRLHALGTSGDRYDFS